MQKIKFEMTIYLRILLQSHAWLSIYAKSKQSVQKYRFMHHIWENLDFDQN